MWTLFGVEVNNDSTTQFTFFTPDDVYFVKELYLTHSVLSGGTVFDYTVDYTIKWESGSHTSDAVCNMFKPLSDSHTRKFLFNLY